MVTDNHIQALKFYLGEILPLLEREDITDIEINSQNEYVFIDGAEGRERTNIKVQRGEVLAFINRIASLKGSFINEDNPTLSAILPSELYSCRLEATIPPICREPGPNIVIRKPGKNFPISDYVNKEIEEIIISELKIKSNILICGSTSSGKTSFLNSVLEELNKVCPDDRIIILEDENEVNCSFNNHDYLFTHHSPNEKNWNMSDNVKKSLRKNPDRIVVGEVRGSEAREVLTAWDTGHGGGLCTLHAGGARQGFMRFFRMAELEWNNPLDQMFAGEAIDMIFYLSKEKDGRKVREIVKVDFNYSPKIMRPEFSFIYQSNKQTNENK